MDQFQDRYYRSASMVLNELEKALLSVDLSQLERLEQVVLRKDKVFFVGVGRVMLSLQAIAKRWAHLGISTHCVGEIAEPAITPNDLLIVGSGSGNSIFPLNIARKAKSIGAEIVHVGSNPKSEMENIANFMVRIPVRTKLYLKDEIESKQPMTSLFEQALLILGDILAIMFIEKKRLNLDDLWQYHANLE